MAGILIAIFVTIVVVLDLMVPNVTTPPAGVSANTADTYSDDMMASSIAAHIIYYQQQAIYICEVTSCSAGFINGILDPQGDNGDYGTYYMSVWEPSGYVATTYVSQGDQSFLMGNVVEQLKLQADQTVWTGQYNSSTSSFINGEGQTIPLANYTYGSNNATMFNNYAPVFAEPVQQIN